MSAHIVAQHCTQCAALAQEIVQLQAELQLADRDAVWGVFTRRGLERRMPKEDRGMAVVVFDIDRMHDANDRYGHAGVDERMTVALRVTDQHPTGRWQHGDELVSFVPISDALGMALRVQAELIGQGLSATCAVVWACSHAAVAQAQARIEQAKRANERGRVFVVQP